MALLDFYKQRFGQAVKQQGNGWNGPCPLCGGEPGKSDRFMVWPERAEKLGEVCSQHGISGIWACRQCGHSGDTIAYLMQIEGLDFKAALAELGIQGQTRHKRRPAPTEPRKNVQSFTPREQAVRSDAWSVYAAQLLDEAEAHILQEAKACSWLAARGICSEAITQYRLGYLPAENGKYPKYQGRWRYRSALGLAPKEGQDGKMKEKIFIPRGILIPTFGHGEQAGRILNLRIRRHAEDLAVLQNGKTQPKYMELEGSCTSPMLLAPQGPTQLATYFVVEAELDAILIHYISGGLVGALAVRTNRGKPDAYAHERLQACARICVALDYDEPGACGWPWWENTYPQAKRWPVPEGKDPGDAYKLGVDIREWIQAALPPSCKLAALASTGQVDFSASGLVSVGNGVPEKTLTLEGTCPHKQARGNEALVHAFSEQEMARLRAALPAHLSIDQIHEEVLRAWLLWYGLPIRFVKENGGFSWEYDWEQRKKSPERWETFRVYKDKANALWEWLSMHPAKVINYKNLFEMKL